MKAWIKSEDWFPVRVLYPEPQGVEVEVTPEQVERWERVRLEFEKVQDEMTSAVEVAHRRVEQKGIRKEPR